MARIADPLTPRQAARLEPLGLLADDPDGLRDVWTKVDEMWGGTVQRARALSPAILDERVGDGWSFVQTLRHLVFVTDSWIGRVVLELPSPHAPMGLPPHFVDGSDHGLDPDAAPSLDEVLAVRAERVELVSDTLARADPDELDRVCAPVGGRFTVLGSIQVVVFEEWAHHAYATRDLPQLLH
jgi:hypothetical protein